MDRYDLTCTFIAKPLAPFKKEYLRLQNYYRGSATGASGRYYDRVKNIGKWFAVEEY